MMTAHAVESASGDETGAFDYLEAVRNRQLLVVVSARSIAAAHPHQRYLLDRRDEEFSHCGSSGEAE